MRVVVSGNVLLPIDELNTNQISNIKDLLTIYPKKTTDIMSKADPPPIFMYEETENYLAVPRGWYLKHITKRHEEILDVSYGEPMSDLRTNYRCDGHFVEQGAVLKMFEAQMKEMKWGGFLLQAGCAFGKSSTAIEFARRIGRKTLILVHKEFFLNQWKDRILGLMPDAKVGIIQQNICDYNGKDFVIGMLQSLARDDGSGSRYPSEIGSVFGTIISDEVHRVASQTWSPVIPHFKSAWRIGLSATPSRKDGTQCVFFNHISDITYKAKTKSQVPGIRIIESDARLIPIRRGSYHVPVEKLNSAQILTQLGNDEFRSKDIVDQIVLAVQNGRKIMVVSERISHLNDMSTMLADSLFRIELPFDPIIDYYTGEWYSGEVWDHSTKKHKKGDPKLVKRTIDDLRRAESANVIFSTKQMIQEGLDIEALDVIVLSTPMSDIEQTVGRVQRWCVPEKKKCERLCPWRAGKCKEKPQPIVLDVLDPYVSRLDSKWRSRQRFYRKIGAKLP